MGALFMMIMVLPGPEPLAADGEQILQQRCVQCHELKNAGPGTLDQLWAQKGPNFSYAGNKYKQDWIARWLTAPTRIRPAGMFYGSHIKPGEEHDEIDLPTLVDHITLAPDEAKAVAAALMEYKAKSELIEPGAYQPGTISLSMGDLLFIKFRGCSSCHRIEPGYGGVSGPEVYTAASRLQEDYIISFLKNPGAWSPLTFMPQYHLKDSDLQKFVHYFRALAKEDTQ
jgi:mono/diheme cytochrome c family protein